MTADERQYMISEEKEREVKDKITRETKTESFMNHKTSHSTIEGALTSFLDHKLRKSNITTFEGVIKKQKEHKLLLRKWFKLAGLDMKLFTE